MLNELEQKIRKAIPELELTSNDFLISKPIQLNHVLEYVMKENNLLIKENILVNLFLSGLWNLKSNLLSDQSEELIKYLNEL